ncbi:hypothetical protein EYC08_17570 [Tabrizicola sp. WMC-M-20]|nr:hypothetical protein EYC08_17570 [Tabrizicola sp. WMC-M-20]
MSNTGFHQPVVLLDSTELMPGVAAGDVVAEELGIEVPYGSVIVIDNIINHAIRVGPGASGNFGHVIGEMLLRLMAGGEFPLGAETNALYRMACACQKFFDDASHTGLGLDMRFFRTGLATALGAYWAGTGPAARYFTRPDALGSANVLAYLHDLDASFRVPEPASVPATLLVQTDQVGTYGESTRRILCAVADNLRGAAAQA